MSNAYVSANAAAALAAAAFTGTGVPLDSSRLLLNDGRMDRQTIWSASSSLTLDIDFGTPTAISGWAILNHNMATLDTPRVTIISSASSIYASPTTMKSITTLNLAQPRHRDHVFQHFQLAAQYWRITFTFASSGVLKIGEVVPYVASTVLTRGYTDGSGEPEEFVSVGAQMMYGETRSAFLAGPMRHKRLRFQDYTTANNAEMLAMWRSVKGTVNPLLWIEDYEAVSTAAANSKQDCIYGRLSNVVYDWSWTDFDLVQPAQLELRQLGRGIGQ